MNIDKNSLFYAIDFGTSNSLLGAADKNRIYDPIPLDSAANDPTILRSVLYFPDADGCFYGSEAIRHFSNRDMQGRLIRSVKRFLPSRSFVGTWIGNRPLNLEEMIGLFLREMRLRANRHFGVEGDQVVLGRPAKFTEDEGDDRFAQDRLAMAAKWAGFKRIEFLPEPVAAAFGYRLFVKKPTTILVADFGGGTSDYTVMKLDPADYRNSQVLSVGGVPIAGDILDGSLMKYRISKYFGADLEYRVPFGSNIVRMPQHLMSKICSPAEIALLRKKDSMEFLRNLKKWSIGEKDQEKIDNLFLLIEDQLGFPIFEAIESLKRELSEKFESDFEFSYVDLELNEKVSRTDFENYTQERIKKMMAVLDETVLRAGVASDQIEQVCCTGGTARVPALVKGLEDRFGISKIVFHNHFHGVVQGLIQRAFELAS